MDIRLLLLLGKYFVVLMIIVQELSFCYKSHKHRYLSESIPRYLELSYIANVTEK